jgi:hypothetical protein
VWETNLPLESSTASWPYNLTAGQGQEVEGRFQNSLTPNLHRPCWGDLRTEHQTPPSPEETCCTPRGQRKSPGGVRVVRGGEGLLNPLPGKHVREELGFGQEKQ